MGRGKEIWIAASALSVVLAAQAQAAEQQRSGVAGFARGASSARGSSGAPQALRVGDPVFFDQTISTDANGRALIIMADRSTLAVGPNSNIVIEKYAYDKASGTGELVMNAARGLFRFVGGALSKKRPVEMRIATGTIGVRGGVIFVDIPGSGAKGLSGGDAGGGNGDGGGGRVGLLYGDSLTFTNNNGQSTEVNRPGTIIEFTDSGETSVYEADANMLAEIATQLENPNKQASGSSESGGGAGTNVDPTITDTTITDSNEVAEVLDRELNTALDTFQQTQQTLIDTAQEMMDDDLDEPDPDPMMPGGSGGLSPGV